MSAWLLRLLGVLLMAGAIGVALSRAPDRPVESLVARWAPPPSDFVEVKGMVVHVRDEGPRQDPLPVVLVHGTGASLHTWEGWVQALKAQRRVITLDLPAFGLTGPFAGQYAPGDYRGDTYARFMLDLMDKLKVQRFVIGGNSLGGEVAWRTAVAAPDRVDRLVLVDAAGPAFAPKSVPMGFVLARLPVVNRLSEHLLPRSLIHTSLTNVYGDPSRVTSALVDRYFELTLREGNRRIRSALVEAIWRMLRWNPQWRGFAKHGDILRDKRGSSVRKKKAAIACVRLLFIDLWRLNTGRTTLAALGLKPKPAREDDSLAAIEAVAA